MDVNVAFWDLKGGEYGGFRQDFVDELNADELKPGKGSF